MTTLAPRPCAEAAPVTAEIFNPEEFPAWSSLSWDERAEYVALYCR